MAVRTKRARMLYKLIYLLGPESEEYQKEEDEKPYCFSTAVKQVLAIYGYKYWADRSNGHVEAQEQLIKDYADLLAQISDDNLSEKNVMSDEMITCTRCNKDVEENGYCEVDGSPYGDCCWTEHVENCSACKEQSEC